MKKYFALILALAMMLSLAACGSGGAPASTPDAAPGASAPAEDASAGDDAAPAGPAEITLSMSCFDTADSFNDHIAQTFIDKVTEVSNGAIGFQYYQNGTYCSLMEDYDFVCSGSLDCSWTYPGPNMPTIPWGYSTISTKSMEDGVNLANFLYTDDPTCSAIVEKYTRMNGAVCLGTCQEGGSSVAVSTFEFNDWSELNTHKNGATRDQDMYASMGQNVVSLNQPDLYDSLSRGVCDFTVYNTASVLSGKLLEVAPYVYNTGTYGNALTFYINADVYDGLTEEQQGWLKEGIAAAQAWALENGAVYQEELKSQATSWVEASPEDANYIGESMLRSGAALCLNFAENLNGQEGLEDMIYLIRVQEEWLGMEILPDEYASYRDSVQVTID